MIRRRRPLLPGLLVVGLLLAGCTAAPREPVVDRSATPRAIPAAPAPPTAAERAAAVVADMTPAERAGQVLMTAGTVQQLPGLAGAVRRYSLAGVMVRGRSAAGTAAVAKAFRPVQAAAPDGLPLLTATDQEGGLVQVLRGPGFSAIPSAVRQGGLPLPTMRADAKRWGTQLVKAGVRLDLAPVADVPCATTLHDNPPIADLDRQFSADPVRAGRHAAAFVAGMRDAGVATAVKHFPGLGCVRANTDTTAHVVDKVTTAGSARLGAFAAGIDADTAFVMMSSAEYSKIDPGTPALFSSEIIGGLLRDRLGFDGVVMSDDVGGAKAVRRWTPAQRAVRFVDAGGDLLLDIVAKDLGAMHGALVQRAAKDPAFDAKLTAAAERVVEQRLALAD